MHEDMKNRDTGKPNLMPEPDRQANWETEYEDSDLAGKRLDKKLAHALERRMKDVFSISLDFCPVEIRNIEFDEDGLLISTQLPFLLLPSPRDRGEWPYPRRDQVDLREKFAKFLMSTANQKELSDFFYVRLQAFLMEHYGFHKSGQNTLTYLKNFAKRALAGRPTPSMTRTQKRQISNEGKLIYEAIMEIQLKLESAKKRSKSFNHAKALRKIRREYPVGTVPWIEHFVDLSDALPRRRYLPMHGDEITDADGKLPPCNLSNPEHWSTVGIAVRVMQCKLFQETRNKFPLQMLKALIGPAS